MRTQVKSPVQWLVQTSKILETGLPKPAIAVNALRQLGQVPFAPPNVKGWDGGRAWITTSTLLFRYNLANFSIGQGSLNLASLRPGANVTKRRRGAGHDVSKLRPARHGEGGAGANPGRSQAGGGLSLLPAFPGSRSPRGRRGPSRNLSPIMRTTWMTRPCGSCCTS